MRKNVNVNAAYIRLSKEDEKEGESESVTNQKELIRKYVEQNNLGICEFFIDDGYSGGNFERPQFKEMINKIENGEISTVITKDTSRLGRDFIETSHYMFKYFPEHNVRYIAILENFDTFNPNGVEDVIPFQTIINDWYLKDTSKKIQSIRHNKMKKGYYMGSTVPYGYKRSSENNCKFEIDEYASEIVKRIFKMRIEGIKPTMIARILSDEKIEPPSIYNGKNFKKTYTSYLWKYSSVDKILTNPIYIGRLEQRKYGKVNYKSKKKVKLKEEDWIVVENFTTPIISREDFEIVQKMKKQNIYISPKGYNYLLKGIVVCADCGSPMIVRKRKVHRKRKESYEETYYCCSTYARYRNGVCSLHYFQEKELNDIVTQYLKKVFKNNIDENELKKVGEKKETKNCSIQSLDTELAKLEKKIEKVQIALKNIYIDKTSNFISENDFLEIKKQLENDRKEYEREIAEIKKKINSNKHNNDKSSMLEETIKQFLNLECPDKQIYMQLIKRIEIEKDKKVKIFLDFNLDKEVV